MQTALQRLNREFLQIRSRLLDISAALDRIDAGSDGASIASDARLTAIREAAGILADAATNRAERVQLLFSDPYDEDWRAKR